MPRFPIKYLYIGAVILGLSTLGYLGHRVYQRIDSLLSRRPQTVVITVPDSSLIKEVQKLRDSEPSIIERIIKEQVPPDTVYVSQDTLSTEDRHALPHAAIKVRCESCTGKSLTVTDVDYNTGEIRRLKFPLPEKGRRDWELLGGAGPSHLSVNRRLGGLDISVLGRIQWPVSGQSPRLTVAGPLTVEAGPVDIRPYASINLDGDTEVGIEGEVEF